jgi:hypothetical protein
MLRRGYAHSELLDDIADALGRRALKGEHRFITLYRCRVLARIISNGEKAADIEGA